MKEVTKFMSERIKVPNSLNDKESVEKMILILFPCFAKRPTHSAKKKHPLFLIFKENNQALRMKFFKDPLIKFLW